MLRIAPLVVVLVAVVLSLPPTCAQPIQWEVSHPLTIAAGDGGVLTIVLENTHDEPVEGVLSLELSTVAKGFDVERQMDIHGLAHSPRLNTTEHRIALAAHGVESVSFLITTSPDTPAGVYAGRLVLTTDTPTSLGVITFCVRKKDYTPIALLVLLTCILAVLTARAMRREHH